MNQYILLLEAKILMMLYLHEKEFQVLCFVTVCEHLVGGHGYMS